MRKVFLVNRAACDGRAGSFWASAEGEFRKAFPNLEVSYPETGDACRQMAKEIAASDGPVQIVTVGGEGTMNRALIGIMESGRADQVTMALVPFGNVNDYGANIGLQKNWRHALETLKSGKQVPVGVVRITTDSKVEYALNLADIGFGATTAKSHSVDHQLSWLKGQFKYTILALKTLLKWKNVPARIMIDDEVLTGDVAIMLAGFSPTLGAFHLVPHAAADSDHLAVTFGINASKLEILGLIDAAKKNRLQENELIHFRTAKRVLVEAEQPMAAEVDGEIVSTNAHRVLFEAMPGAIKFMVPAGSVLARKQD